LFRKLAGTTSPVPKEAPPLFILLFGTLAIATSSVPKEAGIKTNPNNKQLVCPMANGMIDRQRMSYKEQVITNKKTLDTIH
jgi:hypothetical protein